MGLLTSPCAAFVKPNPMYAQACHSHLCFYDRSGKAMESALYALGSAYVPTMGQF